MNTSKQIIAILLPLFFYLMSFGQTVKMVADINQDSLDSNPSHLTTHNAELYFFCDYQNPDGIIDFKRNLFVVNKKSGLQIVDTCGRSVYYSGSNRKRDWIPSWMGAYYRMPYFLGSSGNGLLYCRNNFDYDLYQNNLYFAFYNRGNIDTNNFQGDPSPFGILNNKIFFSDYVSNSEIRQIWVYEESQMPMIEESQASFKFNRISEAVYHNDKFYYLVVDSEGYGSLMEWDAVNEPLLLTELNEYNYGYDSFLSKPIVFKDKLYFSFRNQTENGWVHLWSYDFSNSSIAVTNEAFSYNDIIEVVAFNKKLFCINTKLNKLVVSDGNGEYNEIASIKTDYDSGSSDFLFKFSHLVVFNDTLFFSGYDSINGNELWVFDGINEPELFTDIKPGIGSSNPTNFYEFNNKLYFSADDGIHGYELWVYDPGTTTIVEDAKETRLRIYPNPTNQTLNIQLTNLNIQYSILNIYNLTGQQVLSQTINSPNHSIDVSNLSKGYYIISVSDATGNSVGSQSVVVY